MDPLTNCVEALRALAKEPLSGNQALMAEYRITEFLGAKVANRKSTLERLRNAIDAEAGKAPKPFWATVQEYVNSLLVKAGVA
jgi:alcohol dehydrogenase class IV